MNIYLRFPSALEYLQSLDAAALQDLRLVETDSIADASASLRALREAGLAGHLSEPVAVFASSDAQRSHTRRVRARVRSSPLPRGSLCRSGEGGPLVSTPGFCLLQASYRLGVADLLQLGLELCGTYSSGPHATEAYLRARPLTTAASLRRYLGRAGTAGTARGIPQTLSLLADGIGSPMEAVTYLLLCLPHRYGGYGLPLPQANLRIDVPAARQRYAGRTHYRADLCWPAARLIVEYDSDAFHAGGEKGAEDSTRRTALMALGYEVHTLNMAQLKNQRAMDQLARRIATRTGRRLREGKTPEQRARILGKRRELRGSLLDRSRDWKHAAL